MSDMSLNVMAGIEEERPETSSTEIQLSQENYVVLLRCLTNLKEVCNDVDLRGGIIRQRSNDRTSIFEMDLTSIIQNATLPISNLKKKLDLMKIFLGQDVVITINEASEVSESSFTLADIQSSIKISFPEPDYMDNRLMEEAELNNIFNLDENDLILQEDFSKVLTERIRIITDNFNTQSIQVRFDGDHASVHAGTQSKDQSAVFKDDITTNMSFEGNYISNISTLQFGIEHDTDLTFKMYKDPNQNVSLNKISTNLGDVNLNIFSRSSIIAAE